MSRLPNFIIVGAAKCGTTSLFEYLSAHPGVFTPTVKEPSFFALSVPSRMSNWDEYQRLFIEAADEPRVGEASVAYLYDASAPREMQKRLSSDLKIIIMLRNPVDMMYSLWGHMRRVGREPMEFGRALKAEEERMNDKLFCAQSGAWDKNFAYYDRARYSHQLARFFEVFGRANIHVIIYEEFFADPRNGYREVCRFLGLEQEHQPSFLRHNPAGTVHSTLFRRVLNNDSAAKLLFKMMLPIGVRTKVRTHLEALNRVNRPLPLLSPDDRASLAIRLSGELDELQRMLGRDLSIWRN